MGPPTPSAVSWDCKARHHSDTTISFTKVVYLVTKNLNQIFSEIFSEDSQYWR